MDGLSHVGLGVNGWKGIDWETAKTISNYQMRNYLFGSIGFISDDVLTDDRGVMGSDGNCLNFSERLIVLMNGLT